MGAIHRVIPDDRPGQVWWFHGNSGSGKTNIALKFDVPNKIVLDADDFRVLDQRRADPDASARQIGRLLGHDKNWVIRRDDKIKRALKGFITITEEVSNEA